MKKSVNPRFRTTSWQIKLTISSTTMMIANGLPLYRNLRTAVTMTSIILLIQILTAVMTGIPETAGIPGTTDWDSDW